MAAPTAMAMPPGALPAGPAPQAQAQMAQLPRQMPTQLPPHQQGQTAGGYHVMPSQQPPHQQGTAAGYRMAPAAEAGARTGGPPSPGCFACTDPHASADPAAARWQYVGDGRGGYQPSGAANYHYVGFGQGNFEKQTVVMNQGWQVRKCCIVFVWTIPVAIAIVWALLAMRPSGAGAGESVPAANSTVPGLGAGLPNGSGLAGITIPELLNGLPNGTAPHGFTIPELAIISGLNISQLDVNDVLAGIGSNVTVGSGNVTAEDLLKGIELYDCEQKPVESWPQGQAVWCCGHHHKGCNMANASLTDDEEEDFDCEAGYSKWKRGWSAEKKQFCCETEQKGCEVDDVDADKISNASTTTSAPTTTTTTEHYECTNLEATTPLRTRVWCCLHKRVDCPKQNVPTVTPAPNQGGGPPGAPPPPPPTVGEPTAAPGAPAGPPGQPPQDGKPAEPPTEPEIVDVPGPCGAKCSFFGHTNSCMGHIKFSEHKWFHDSPKGCLQAFGLISGYCPECGHCSSQEAGCPGGSPVPPAEAGAGARPAAPPAAPPGAPPPPPPAPPPPAPPAAGAPPPPPPAPPPPAPPAAGAPPPPAPPPAAPAGAPPGAPPPPPPAAPAAPAAPPAAGAPPPPAGAPPPPAPLGAPPPPPPAAPPAAPAGLTGPPPEPPAGGAAPAAPVHWG